MAKSLVLLVPALLLLTPAVVLTQPKQPEAVRPPGRPRNPHPNVPGIPPNPPGNPLPPGALGQPPQQPPYRPQPPLPVWLFPILFLPLLILHQRKVEQQAREAQRQREEEEETKTPYGEEDLMANYEFKIVRNDHNLFDHGALLDEVLREEAHAGWQLVEKFDGNRLRLKRAVTEQTNHPNLPSDYDPYRTTVLIAQTKVLRRQKRRKELRIAAWVLAVSLALTPLFVAGARMNDPGLGQFLFIMGAIIAPVFALISAIGLSVRFFSE